MIHEEAFDLIQFFPTLHREHHQASGKQIIFQYCETRDAINSCKFICFQELCSNTTAIQQKPSPGFNAMDSLGLTFCVVVTSLCQCLGQCPRVLFIDCHLPASAPLPAKSINNCDHGSGSSAGTQSSSRSD